MTPFGRIPIFARLCNAVADWLEIYIWQLFLRILGKIRKKVSEILVEAFLNILRNFLVPSFV